MLWHLSIIGPFTIDRWLLEQVILYRISGTGTSSRDYTRDGCLKC